MTRRHQAAPKVLWEPRLDEKRATEQRAPQAMCMVASPNSDNMHEV